MKLNKYPLFDELLKVFDEYEIQAWAISDFVFHINDINKTDAGNDYHKLGRLIFRLVKDGYLSLDLEISQGSPRTYSETEKLIFIRNIGNNEADEAIQDLLLKIAAFNLQLEKLMGDLKALEALKDVQPSIRIKL